MRCIDVSFNIHSRCSPGCLHLPAFLGWLLGGFNGVWWVNAVTWGDARQLAQVEVKGGTSTSGVVAQLASSMVRFLLLSMARRGRAGPRSSIHVQLVGRLAKRGVAQVRSPT